MFGANFQNVKKYGFKPLVESSYMRFNWSCGDFFSLANDMKVGITLKVIKYEKGWWAFEGFRSVCIATR
jgi:hypothetical protein